MFLTQIIYFTIQDREFWTWVFEIVHNNFFKTYIIFHFHVTVIQNLVWATLTALSGLWNIWIWQRWKTWIFFFHTHEQLCYRRVLFECAFFVVNFDAPYTPNILGAKTQKRIFSPLSFPLDDVPPRAITWDKPTSIIATSSAQSRRHIFLYLYRGSSGNNNVDHRLCFHFAFVLALPIFSLGGCTLTRLYNNIGRQL